MIRFACPSCSQQYTVKDDYAGKVTTCQKCQVRMIVPALSAVLVHAEVQPPSLPETKDCPFCGESVKVHAKKCKHCGETLDVALRAAEEVRNTRNSGGGGGNQQVVIHQSEDRGPRVVYVGGFPHFIHLILTIFTLGLWFPIWIIHYIVWSLTRSH
jgi:hypothetical protein